MTSERAYRAFISYSHRVDRELARTLQSDLERFGRRWPWSRALRIYRDETNLSASPDLWESIKSALDNSDRLILLASTGSARSTWVPRELEHFTNQRGKDAICIVLTLGKTRFTDAGDILPEEKALADSTAEFFTGSEPLVVDLRKFRDAPRRARVADDYPNAIATIAAFVTGIDKDRLFSEHIARRRRWVRGMVVAAAVVLTLVMVAAAQTAARRLEETRAREAELRAAQEQIRAQRLRDISSTERQAGLARLHAQEEPDLALTEAARSWRASPGPAGGLEEPAIEELARAARAAAAFELSTALRAHPGLVGTLRGGHGAVRALSASTQFIMAYDSDGHALQWPLSSPGAPVPHLISPVDDIDAEDAVSIEGMVLAKSEGKRALWTGSQTVPIPIQPIGTVAIGRHGDLFGFSTITELFLYDRARSEPPFKLSAVLPWSSVPKAFSPRGDLLYVGEERSLGEIVVWDPATRRQLPTTFRLPRSGETTHIAVAADGGLVAATYRGGHLAVWDSAGRLKDEWSIPAASGVVFDPSESKSHPSIFTSHDDGQLRGWMVGREEPFEVRYAHRGGITAIAMAPNGIVLTGGRDSVVRLWSVGDPLVRNLYEADALAARFDARGLVALRSREYEPAPARLVWSDDVFQGASQHASPSVEPLPRAPSFRVEALGADDLVVGTSVDKAARKVNVVAQQARSDEELQLISIEPPARMEISPRGHHLVLSSPWGAKGLWVWDLTTKAPARTDLLPDAWASAFAFDRLGTHLIAAIKGGEMRLWSTSSPAPIKRALLTKEEVAAITVDDKLEHLAFGLFNGDIEVRRLDSPDKTGVRIRALSSPVTALAFHPKELWLAAIDHNGDVLMVDILTGTPVGRFERVHVAFDQPTHLEFNEFGNRLLVKGGSSPNVLNTDPNEWATLAERIAGVQPDPTPAAVASKP